MPSFVLLILLAMTSLRQDETIRNYGMGDQTWQVIALNGAPFPATATMQFTGRYQIKGQAPCNSFRTSMKIPYPWFKVGPVAATKRACPELAQEAAFFAALRATTLAQVAEGQLLLSDDDKPLIVLKPVD